MGATDNRKNSLVFVTMAFAVMAICYALYLVLPVYNGVGIITEITGFGAAAGSIIDSGGILGHLQYFFPTSACG